MIRALAPMDGITDLPYRTIVHQIFNKHTPTHNTSTLKAENSPSGISGTSKGPKNSSSDFSTSLTSSDSLRTRTEFMNVNGYMIQPNKLVKHLIHHDQENALIAQIYGGNDQPLYQTAHDIIDKYPQFMGVELNIGCPSPKVMACGGGSGMMRDKSRTLAIIQQLSHIIGRDKFSIKVRTGINIDDKEERFDILTQCIPYVHCVSIHGRTIKDGHSGPVDRDYIHRFKAIAQDECLVIGNGGISSYDQAIHHTHTATPYDEQTTDASSDTQLDGIMVGQSAIANPRLFTPHTPTITERYQTIIDHLHLAVAYEIRCNEHIPTIESEGTFSTNKAYLHALKKYDPNSDDSYDLPPLQRHDYSVTMPTLASLHSIRDSLHSTKYNLESLHTPTTFRKYLFNYIRGLPGSKDLKIKAASITNFIALQEAIDSYFQSLKKR